LDKAMELAKVLWPLIMRAPGVTEDQSKIVSMALAYMAGVIAMDFDGTDLEVKNAVGEVALIGHQYANKVEHWRDE
jgi:Cu/Ag efflux pump CusA